MTSKHLLFLLALGLFATSCAARRPGGRADRFITSSYADDNVVYHGVGIGF